MLTCKISFEVLLFLVDSSVFLLDLRAPYRFKSFIKLEQDLAHHHISVPHHFCILISGCPCSGLIFTLCLEWNENEGRDCIFIVWLVREKRKQSKRDPSGSFPIHPK